MPDKPVGRHGSVLQASPVKQYAVSKELPVLQPEKLKDEAFLSELRALKADLPDRRRFPYVAGSCLEYAFAWERLTSMPLCFLNTGELRLSTGR